MLTSGTSDKTTLKFLIFNFSFCKFSWDVLLVFGPDSLIIDRLSDGSTKLNGLMWCGFDDRCTYSYIKKHPASIAGALTRKQVRCSIPCQMRVDTLLNNDGPVVDNTTTTARVIERSYEREPIQEPTPVFHLGRGIHNVRMSASLDALITMMSAASRALSSQE